MRADVGIGPYGEGRSAFVIVGATCVSPVAKPLPPSDEGGGFAAGEDGGRETKRDRFSPPVFCFTKASPLIRGGQVRYITNRICVCGRRAGPCVPPWRTD